MNIVSRLREYGLAGTLKKLCPYIIRKTGIESKYYSIKYRNIARYQNPTQAELLLIEEGLQQQGIKLHNYFVNKKMLNDFGLDFPFPGDYHGGRNGGVWNEKILEHYIAYDLLNLRSYSSSNIYVDVAACGSPWAKILRDKLSIRSYAIDLAYPKTEYLKYDYYKVENAVSTSFTNSEVRGMSLQCAFEMFNGHDDIGLIKEASRILEPGGKLIISPLYMHTHYCFYSSPDFFGKGYADKDGKEYIRMDSRNIPASRKYDVVKLAERILSKVDELGMKHKLHVLRNGKELSDEVYCHFILEVSK
jgi:hypothetical protein